MSESRGKYFGVCTSFHHSKGCNCIRCPSSPKEGVFMYCSKGSSKNAQPKAGCLCEECIVYEQFAFKGEYFCQP